MKKVVNIDKRSIFFLKLFIFSFKSYNLNICVEKKIQYFIKFLGY